MHLNKKAFAHSMAVTTAIVMVVFYVLQIMAPAAFAYIFNAQFFGADLAAMATGISFGTFIGVLITMTIFGWVMGWLIAHFYNKSAK